MSNWRGVSPDTAGVWTQTFALVGTQGRARGVTARMEIRLYAAPPSAPVPPPSPKPCRRCHGQHPLPRAPPVDKRCTRPGLCYAWALGWVELCCAVLGQAVSLHHALPQLCLLIASFPWSTLSPPCLCAGMGFAERQTVLPVHVIRRPLLHHFYITKATKTELVVFSHHISSLLAALLYAIYLDIFSCGFFFLFSFSPSKIPPPSLLPAINLLLLSFPFPFQIKC